MHVMIDLETLGTRPNSAIVQIGAVMFEPVSGGKVLNDKALNVCVIPDDKATVDASTIAWWLTQSQAARSKLAAGMDNAKPEYEALGALSSWPATHLQTTWEAIDGVWAHGPTFDLALLQNAFDRQGMQVPWHYRAPRDTRTLYMLAGGTPEVDTAGLVEHDAVSDCVIQIMQVQQALRLRG